MLFPLNLLENNLVHFRACLGLFLKDLKVILKS